MNCFLHYVFFAYNSVKPSLFTFIHTTDLNFLGQTTLWLEIYTCRQRGRSRKTWKEVVDMDMDDLHIKISDAMDHTTWRQMNRGSLEWQKQWQWRWELNMNCTFLMPVHTG